MLKWLNPLRWFAFLLLGALLALAVASCILFVFPKQDPVGRADAVFVLAGGKERLDKALGLMRRGVAGTLVIDDGRSPEWPQANRVCRGGRPYRVLCVKAEPFSTRGEARLIAALARRHGWRSVVVVTSTYHVSRARKIVRRCFPAARVVGADPEKQHRWPIFVASEWLKLGYAVIVKRGC